MAYLALYGEGKILRAKDLAPEINIPVFYLSKILRRMVAAELLTGSKGHHGGFKLSKSPSKIRFIDILEAVEGKDHVPLCVFGWDKCSDKVPCILHHRWKEAKSSFIGWAADTTLADLKKDFSLISAELLPGTVRKANDKS
jgi:Rrf2 family iron-sulfur cluster assembly transcriptional regulator